MNTMKSKIYKLYLAKRNSKLMTKAQSAKKPKKINGKNKKSPSDNKLISRNSNKPNPLSKNHPSPKKKNMKSWLKTWKHMTLVVVNHSSGSTYNKQTTTKKWLLTWYLTNFRTIQEIWWIYLTKNNKINEQKALKTPLLAINHSLTI